MCTFWTPPGSPNGYGFECAPDDGAPFGFNGGNVSIVIPTPDVPIGNWTTAVDKRDGSFPTIQVTSMAVGTGAIHNVSSTTPMLAVFDVIDAKWWPYGNESWETASQWYFDPPTAQECGLWLCLQSTKTQTINGSQSETILASADQVTTTMLPTLLGAGVFTDLPSNFTSSPDFFETDGFGYIDSFSQPIFCGTEVGIIDSNLNEGTGTATLFNGDGHVKFEQPQNFIGSPLMQKVNQQLNTTTGDLNPWIQQIAKSLTNSLRSNNAGMTAKGNVTFAGTVETAEAVFEIRWAWLILPIVMVLLSSLFLILTIMQSIRAHVPAWKGSPLALLFCRVDDEVSQMAETSLDRADDVVEKVRGTPIALYREESGRWLFGPPTNSSDIIR